jgi:hypothetical protein
VLVGISCLSWSQGLFRRDDINLPKDSVAARKLTSDLTLFLAAKDKPNKDNPYVLKEELLATSDLLDEMKGMDKTTTNTYKCYLTNMVQLDSIDYVVQIAYTDMEKAVGELRASYRLMAKKIDGKFYFYSPLKQNTSGWKIKKFDNLTCHYKDKLNADEVKLYGKTVASYDKRLKAQSEPIEFYDCDNFTEVQQILGIDYKLDYNSVKNNSLTAHEDNANLVINGGYSERHIFDAHDLWHARLRTVMSSKVINRPVDEGCAYLYGGSWGYSKEEIFAKFKAYAAANPNADWLTLYTTSGKFEDGEKPMYVAYMLNALIIQKMEREKGFDQVKDLLSCGPRQKGDENYFAALEKITGISKADFNARMWELVKGM